MTYDNLNSGNQNSDDQNSEDQNNEDQNNEDQNSDKLKSEDLNVTQDLDATMAYPYAQSEQNSNGLRPGKIIGQNYRLKKFLGEGGMGIAWLADEIIDGEIIREVVVKIVPSIVQKEKTAMKQVRKTFDLVKELFGKGICGIYDLNKDAEYGWFIIMQYANGPSLQEEIYSRPDKKFSLKETVAILKNIAIGLDHAHEQNVLHRDVKPGNIMFHRNVKTGTLDAILIDFGLASEIHTSLSTLSCAPESTSGTPLYMSTEQWNNEKQDARTDQFSLGVIAYEMLAGHRPFDGPSISIIYNQIMNKEVSDIPGYSKVVNDALRKATAKKQNDRFTSCVEFISELEKAIVAEESEKQQAPGSASNSTKASSVPSTEKGLKTGGIMKRAGVIVVAASILIAVFLFFSKGTMKSPEIAKQPSTQHVAPSAVQPEAVVRPPSDPVKIELPEHTNQFNQKFKLIPPGEFIMGIPPDVRNGELVKRYEYVQHPVKISKPFYMGVYEVTVGDFRKFIEATHYKTTAEINGMSSGYIGGIVWRDIKGLNWSKPGIKQTDEHPVVCVSWNDAKAYMDWLNTVDKTIPAGYEYSFPTEAQWEYACRAGTQTDYVWGDDPKDGEKFANLMDNCGAPDGARPEDHFPFNDGYSTTAPVGQFKPNHFGLYCTFLFFLPQIPMELRHFRMVLIFSWFSRAG